jgi:hypothetical protein
VGQNEGDRGALQDIGAIKNLRKKEWIAVNRMSLLLVGIEQARVGWGSLLRLSQAAAG